MTGYGIDEMIQAAAEGVHEIPHDKGPVIQRRRLIDADRDCISGAIGVRLLDDAVRISLCPGQDFIADSLSMVCAPSQFRPHACKV